MHARRSFVLVMALCSLLTPVCLLAQAAPSEGPREPAKPLAEVTISASRVDWRPAGDPERLTLTVAGPGGLYIQREFDAGEAPSFSTIDTKDGGLPDGIYAYELRASGREAQWGHLWVQGGSFMDKVPAPPRPVKPRESVSKPPLSNVTANTTIPGDLIVQGHACIGVDCTAAGGAPLMIKDTFNYQIRFDGSGGHPAERAWVIQANDFSGPNGDFTIRDVFWATIPFRIGAYVPDNALTIATFTGNIGLGSLTPAVRLDVKANSTGQAAARLQNSSATGYSGTEYLDNAGNVDLFFGIDNAASTTRLDSTNNNPIAILTNSAERLRVTPAGNIGIGTTTPATKLHLFDNADVGTVLQVENTSSGVNATGNFRAQSNTAVVHFRAHGSGRTVNHFGVVLGGWSELVQDIGNGLAIGTQNSTPIILGTNNTNRMQITSGGSVGVGTTTPASLFHVNGGDIRVSGGSFIDDGVTLNVPDYVFEPHYELMPLDELRDFVAREKHLPNVPSRDDVKKDGLNLSQVQMRFLEKLEELTLYTLKQNEQVKALQGENAKLNARLQALEQAATTEQQ